MRKIIVLIMILALCKLSFAQVPVNTTLYNPTMTDLCYYNGTQSYFASSYGDHRIGQTTAGNGPYFNFVLIVFDLNQLGGQLHPNNCSVTL